MKASTARDTVLTCPDCGFATKPTTQALAEHGLRLHSCDLTRERAARAARVEERTQRTGPVRDCQHPRARHQHGTRPAYVFDKCRCRPCTDAAAAYERNRVKQTVYGRWQPYVDADPAREHVLQLMAAGMGWKRIAKTAGVTLSIVSRLIYGKAETGSRPQPRIRASNAEKILAVRWEPTSRTHVDATGTHRRLQALATLGWSDSKLATRLGMAGCNYARMMRTDRVYARTAAAVRALYDQLWDVPPPEDDHRDRIAASRARNRATRLRWAPPLAWDDDTIDDPSARAHGVERAQQRRRDALIEDVTELVQQGATVASACARLGVQRSNLERTLHRAGRHDLWRRLTGSDPLARNTIDPFTGTGGLIDERTAS